VELDHGGLEMSKFKFNLKVILRSPIFLFYLAFLFLSFLLFVIAAILDPLVNYINYAISLRDMEYYGVGMLTASFCVAAYFAQRNTVLEDTCLIPPVRTHLARFFALVFSSHFILSILIIYVVIMSVMQKTDILFSISTFAATGFRWSITIFLGESIGYLAGLLCNRFYIYLLAAPCACVFGMPNSYLFSILFRDSDRLKSIFSGILSTQSPFPSGMALDYVGSQFDTFFAVGVLFKYLLSALVLLLICLVAWCLHGKRSIHFFRKWCVGTVGVCICLAASAFLYVEKFPLRYSATEKLYMPIEEKSWGTISTISGEIDLGQICKVTCNVLLDNVTSSVVTVRLDDSFEDLQILHDGEPVRYTRNGDKITICMENISQEKQVPLDFVYKGYVYYLSDTNNIDVFTSKMAAALPTGFAFLPQADDGNPVCYDLDVSSGNTVISNLNIENVEQSHCYKIHGTSSSICIFSGFLSEQRVGESICYRAKYNVRTDYAALYEKMFTLGAFIDARNGIVEMKNQDMNFRNPKKVFLIFYFYDTGGLPICYDDYVLMNYGYVT
jgi:hypothetical protein